MTPEAEQHDGNRPEDQLHVQAGRPARDVVEIQQNHLLEGNYLRIDHDQSDEQVRDLGLDVATAAARKTLLGLGEKIATDVLGTKLMSYLSHKPQLRIHREQPID